MEQLRNLVDQAYHIDDKRALRTETTITSLASISYGLGLDRLAAIKFDIDDVRKLWQPPYVPG